MGVARASGLVMSVNGARMVLFMCLEYNNTRFYPLQFSALAGLILRIPGDSEPAGDGELRLQNIAADEAILYAGLQSGQAEQHGFDLEGGSMDKNFICILVFEL